MAIIQNLEALNRKLRERAAKALKDSGSVVVGFTTGYVVYVHENLEAKHPIGQAKFLEQPARILAGDLAEIVKGLMQKGKTMVQSLLVAGLRLQREAQQLVPVDTSALKNSAFTRAEK